MIDDRYAEWDAAYVLGSLSSAERLEYEAHLSECDDCATAVRELAGMPGVLGRLDPASATALRDLPGDPTDEETPRLGTVAHLARRVHRRRRATALAGAAAVVLAAVGGAFAGNLIPGTPGPQAEQVRLTPVGESEVTARLTASAVPWGTKLAWSCDYEADSGRYGPTTYRLVVTTRAGQDSTVATWSAHGDGASGLAAATSIPRSDIRSVEIVAGGGGDTVLARAALAP